MLLSEGYESEEDDDVNALAVWEGQLISGHGSGRVRVWDVSTVFFRFAPRGRAWRADR